MLATASSKGSKTGNVGFELQNKIPNALIIYAFATVASEPRDMAYMIRLGLLGLGTPFHGRFFHLRIR